MGADYKGQGIAIRAFKIFFALPWIGKRAKEFLSHHLRNSMNVITNSLFILEEYLDDGKAINKEYFDHANQATKHILEDLGKIGC